MNIENWIGGKSLSSNYVALNLIGLIPQVITVCLKGVIGRLGG